MNKIYNILFFVVLSLLIVCCGTRNTKEKLEINNDGNQHFKKWFQIEVVDGGILDHDKSFYLNLYVQNLTDTGVFLEMPFIDITKEASNGKLIDISTAYFSNVYPVPALMSAAMKNFTDSIANSTKNPLPWELARTVINDLRKSNNSEDIDTASIFWSISYLAFIKPHGTIFQKFDISSLFYEQKGNLRVCPTYFGEPVGSKSIEMEFNIPKEFKGYRYLERSEIRFDTFYLKTRE